MDLWTKIQGFIGLIFNGKIYKSHDETDFDNNIYLMQVRNSRHPCQLLLYDNVNASIYFIDSHLRCFLKIEIL